MYELSVESSFSAAHNLREYRGKCENLHGHNWKVRVLVASEELNALGMVCDFVELKRYLADVLELVDHKYLNEQRPFDVENPTTENLARWITEQIAAKLPSSVSVSAVTVWESERCSATYRK